MLHCFCEQLHSHLQHYITQAQALSTWRHVRSLLFNFRFHRLCSSPPRVAVTNSLCDFNRILRLDDNYYHFSRAYKYTLIISFACTFRYSNWVLKIRIESIETNVLAILVELSNLMILIVNQTNFSLIYWVLRREPCILSIFSSFTTVENITIELCTQAMFYYIFLELCKTSLIR